MRAIKKARKLIEQDPATATAVVFAKLVLALEAEEDFSFKQLYELGIDDFELAIELLKDWRLDRYYEGKAKALSSALVVASAH
ncbi:hypothetical protein [Limnohabitans sp.]|uniref:hypothetical protein n=1 Tax=Limnohabitans sp. TaxID=1907725 RepID=UPI0038BDBBDB